MAVFPVSLPPVCAFLSHPASAFHRLRETRSFSGNSEKTEPANRALRPTKGLLHAKKRPPAALRPISPLSTPPGFLAPKWMRNQIPPFRIRRLPAPEGQGVKPELHPRTPCKKQKPNKPKPLRGSICITPTPCPQPRPGKPALSTRSAGMRWRTAPPARCPPTGATTSGSAWSKAATGPATSELIAERVAREGRMLLRHTGWTVGDIAWSLGFEELPHFIRFFKRHVRLTPKSYRMTEVV